MRFSPDIEQYLAESKAEVEGWSPGAYRETAAFARQMKPVLGSDRQREIFEEIACDLEARADAKIAAGHRP